MPWLPESQLAPETVAFVHRCLTTTVNTTIALNNVLELTDLLTRWVDKAWELQLKQTPQSLTKMCIPATISTMTTAVEQLKTLEESLPDQSNLSRDWGIIRDGASVPYPEINTWELPDAAKVHDLLEQIETVVEWLLRVIRVLDLAVPDSFWQEVASVGGSNLTHVNRIRQITEESLTSALADIRNFTHPQPTQAAAGAGHAGTEQAQTEPAQTEPAQTEPAQPDPVTTSLSQCNALLARLRACMQ